MSLNLAGPPPLPAQAPSSVDASAPTKRIAGIDLARGFALIGMITAHFGLTTDPELLDPGTWGGIVNGRSSILFAILAGVSLALVTGRTQVFTGQKLADARVKILVRALCIYVIGELLTSLNTYISIILQTYAVLFVVALIFLSFKRVWLVALALVWALIGPFLVAVWEPVANQFGFAIPMSELLIWGTYPVLTWIPYILIGLAIGRTDLILLGNKLVLLGTGTALALLGYSSVTAFSGGSGSTDKFLEEFPDAFMAEDTNSVDQILANLGLWNTAGPHSNTPFEIIGSGGVNNYYGQ